MNKSIGGDGTVGKALQVLEDVAAFERPVRFSEVEEHSKLPKATLYRLMQTLTNQGMLNYIPESQTYSPGLKLVRLAHSAWRHSSIAYIAGPFLNELAKEVRETVHLAQLEAGQVLFIDKKRVTDRFETLAQAGLVAPAHCTGVGKVCLAYLSPARLERALLQQTFLQYTPNSINTREKLMSELENIRKTGFAYDREEHETGVISIATSIRRSDGQPFGAVSIATSTNRQSLESLKQFGPVLLKTANQIGVEAEAWNFPQTS